MPRKNGTAAATGDPRIRCAEGLTLIGWTYFIHAPELARIKIGCSQISPAKRLYDFMTGSPATLVGIGVIRGDFYERPLQERFAALKWNREWFRAESILLEFIRDIALPFSAADAVEDLYMTFGDGQAMDDATQARIDRWFLEREENLPESERMIWEPFATTIGSHI